MNIKIKYDSFFIYFKHYSLINNKFICMLYKLSEMRATLSQKACVLMIREKYAFNSMDCLDRFESFIHHTFSNF